MPGAMNGRLLADEALSRRPALKTLYTSGYTENAIVHHGRLDSGVLLLAKPYRKSDLARMIRMALAVEAPPRLEYAIGAVDAGASVRSSAAMNNLLTDIAGVSVGHADDAALASGCHRHHFRQARGGLDRRARRRTRHARRRAARSRLHGGGDRRHRAFGRLRVRAGGRRRRAGLAARTGPRLSHSRRA